MVSLGENGKFFREINLTGEVNQGFHEAKAFWQETFNTLTESTQQVKESLPQTAQQAMNVVTTTNPAFDTVTAITEQIKNSLTPQAAVDRVTTTAQQVKSSLGETIEQTKGSVEHTLQTAGQLETRMSEAMQTAIGSAISDWLQAHPIALRLVRLLLWAIDRPILSLIILLFAVAIAWSLIRAIVRLLDTVGWSLLQAPFKLSLVLIRVSLKSLGLFGSLVANRLGVAQNTEISALQNLDTKQIQPDKQQRLAEISIRLEAIRQEQNELLQEAATILKIPGSQEKLQDP